MKLIKLFVIALLILGLFAACGQKVEKEEAPAVEETQEVPADTMAVEEAIEEPAEEVTE